jgi:hypothetical protein
MAATKPIPIRFSEETQRGLKAAAALMGNTSAGVVKYCVRAFLDYLEHTGGVAGLPLNYKEVLATLDGRTLAARASATASDPRTPASPLPPPADPLAPASAGQSPAGKPRRRRARQTVPGLAGRALATDSARKEVQVKAINSEVPPLSLPPRREPSNLAKEVQVQKAADAEEQAAYRRVRRRESQRG